MANKKKEDKGPPLLFQHAANAYAAMEKTQEPNEDGDVVWTGSLVRFLKDECDISMSQYAQVMSVLKALGCVEMEKRGAAKTPSIWRLLHPPTYEDFKEKLKGQVYSYHGNKGTWNDEKKAQQVADLSQRLSRVEEVVQAQGELLLKLEARLNGPAT